MTIEKDISDLKCAFEAFIRMKIREEAEATVESEMRPNCEIFMVEMNLECGKYNEILKYLK